MTVITALLKIGRSSLIFFLIGLIFFLFYVIRALFWRLLKYKIKTHFSYWSLELGSLIFIFLEQELLKIPEKKKIFTL
jgi:hypothetical protein